MLSIIERQKYLTKLGFNTGGIDGVVGRFTKQAYKDFQKKYNLVVDGIYGVKTNAKLIEVINGLNTNKYVTDWTTSKYFKEYEFWCPTTKNCGPGMYQTLIDLMNDVRQHFGRVIKISSGYRTKEYNDTLIGSSKNSTHIDGRACDFYISFYTISQSKRIEIMNYMKTLPNFEYCYCNINGNHKNMGNAIHVQVKK